MTWTPKPMRASAAGAVPRLGVGLQFNPVLLGWFPFFELQLDVLEVLFDSIMLPLDGPGTLSPSMRQLVERAASKFPLIGHSNYGGDFGFEDLMTTSAVRRHIPLAKRLGVPWVSDHCFYSDASWSNVWSSPVQFSRSEAVRIGERARRLQELYGVPLAHENAAYYRTCPGSDLREEEFLASLLEVSGTYLHLDLHNLYANALNHGARGYSIERFLNTIPLDRIVCVHLAGGRWIDGQYHDLHDTPVPDPVWELLDELLSRASPGAVILEYETDTLRTANEVVGTARAVDLILGDLERARSAWAKAFGAAAPVLESAAA